MPRISIENYDTVASWNGSQDLFVVEQPDGTKVATPAMVKQFIEAGDFEATGEIKDGHGNILKNMAKSADVDEEIGDLSQTGLTGDSVSEQLDTARGQISQLNTNIKDFKNLFVSDPVSTSKTYNFSIPTNAIAELIAASGTNLAQYYIIAASTTLRIIKHTDDVTGLNVTLDSISGGVYNYTVTVPAYALSVAYRIS